MVDISKLQGTIEFMSPEVIIMMMVIMMTLMIIVQVMNCKTASTQSDMWSAGVVSYMLLTGGKSPFYDGSR